MTLKLEWWVLSCSDCHIFLPVCEVDSIQACIQVPRSLAVPLPVAPSDSRHLSQSCEQSWGRMVTLPSSLGHQGVCKSVTVQPSSPGLGKKWGHPALVWILLVCTGTPPPALSRGPTSQGWAVSEAQTGYDASVAALIFTQLQELVSGVSLGCLRAESFWAGLLMLVPFVNAGIRKPNTRNCKALAPPFLPKQ